MEKTVVCKKCGQTRPLSDFHRRRDTARQPCRFCRTKSGGLRRRYTGPATKMVRGGTHYRCCDCEEFLPAEEFSPLRSGGERKIHGSCRKCGVKNAKAWKEKNLATYMATRTKAREKRYAIGVYTNPQASREELIRAIHPRYRHYLYSARKALKKKLDRKINHGNADLRRQYEQALVMTAVTIDEFLDFVLSRQHICECCGKSLDMRVGSTDFAIDHFHDSGRLRGLLCNPCNLALGSFGDDAATVARAKEYLEHHHAKR